MADGAVAGRAECGGVLGECVGVVVHLVLNGFAARETGVVPGCHGARRGAHVAGGRVAEAEVRAGGLGAGHIGQVGCRFQVARQALVVPGCHGARRGAERHGQGSVGRQVPASGQPGAGGHGAGGGHLGSRASSVAADTGLAKSEVLSTWSSPTSALVSMT